MMISDIRKTAGALLAVLALQGGSASRLSAQQADFNEVGERMAIMLQNSHFARLPFNEELSRRFLDDYLRDLDNQRVYFTQQDVDRFVERFGTRLHAMLLERDCMTAATEIYRVFEKRVEERVAQADQWLKGPQEFEFEADEQVMLSRKDAPWPKNDAEALDLWRRQIKEAVLSEVLRRETVARLAREQGKEDPGKADRSPREKVSLRYKRLLASVKDVDEEEIANLFLSAVARSYDPHTDYMSYREMNRFRDGMKNELVGIGALLQGEEDGATRIMGIVVGGPADRQGVLKLNDRVVAVDTLNTGRAEDMVDIMFMKIDKVVDLIRGKEGTTVALKVEPAGGPAGETKIVKIQRGKVEMKDEQASGELIEIKSGGQASRRIGVITLPSFYADFEEGRVRCSVDVERILQHLIGQKIDGLVLDLRNNGGGSLDEVRRMTGFFMEKGPVVQVKDSLGQVAVKSSENGKPIYSGPMVVLTDKSSASASEILAGALQDYNRAVIVGESSTFGKGTVQQPLDIGRNLPLFSVRHRAGFLKATIQKFYRPSGSSTQMEGVKSDIVLPSIMDALEVGEAFLDHCLPHDRIRAAGDFRPLAREALSIPALSEKSLSRVKQCQDFGYIIEDIVKARQRMEANVVSLNKAKREAELQESDQRQKQRNAERRERFAKIAEQDRKQLSFFRVTLQDLDQQKGLQPYDPTDESKEFMRRAKDETEDLDQTPKWPNGLDPIKREGLMIARDLVDVVASQPSAVSR